jgi:hypothetical protein
MNRIMVGSFLVGSVLFAGSFSSVPAEAGLNATVAAPPAVVTPVTLAVDPSAELAVLPPIELRSVNGISLTDDAPGVLAVAGKPERISQDPLVKDLNIFEYGKMQIGVQDGMVSFLSVSGDADAIVLDNTRLPVTLEAIKKAMGEPDFIAEDGLVFRRSERLLKVFIDPDTGAVKSVDYYSMSNA